MNAVIIPILPAIQLKHVLYATDLGKASDTALPIVTAIARRYNSQVYAAHICVPLPYSAGSREAVVAMESQHQRDGRKALEEFLAAQKISGARITPIVRSGNAVTELSRIVRDYHIDLAVFSTHGHTGIRRLVLGSTAEQLFRRLPCPVLMVGPNVSPRFQHRAGIKEILFPTDLSFASGMVFPLIASIAAEYAARITVLHVVPGKPRNRAGISKFENLHDAVQRMFCHQIDPRCNFSILVESGDPVERIVSHCRADNVDLIGFGLLPNGEINTRFRSTIVYRVLLEAECPVLTSHSGISW